MFCLEKIKINWPFNGRLTMTDSVEHIFMKRKEKKKSIKCHEKLCKSLPVSSSVGDPTAPDRHAPPASGSMLLSSVQVAHFHELLLADIIHHILRKHVHGIVRWWKTRRTSHGHIICVCGDWIRKTARLRSTNLATQSTVLLWGAIVKAYLWPNQFFFINQFPACSGGRVRVMAKGMKRAFWGEHCIFLQQSSGNGADFICQVAAPVITRCLRDFLQSWTLPV